ncbi:AFG1 family ATPase [Myxococcota bacterium]|nr:AFG1 family ATPase [Myxococcota bacterium]
MNARLPSPPPDATATAVSGGPLPAWRARVAAGEIRHDPAQEAATTRLQALWERLSDDAPRATPAAIRSWLARVRRRGSPGPQGAYLYGGVGRGKSMLMDLFFASVPDARKRRQHFNAFMLDLHHRIHGWRGSPDEAAEGADPIPPIARRIAWDARLLCLDELQVHDLPDALVLGRLFRELLDRGVTVVVTSNRAPEGLYEHGLQRELFLPFVALMRERLEVIEVDAGMDHRLALLREARVYHVSRDAEDVLDAAFTRLGGGTEEPGELDVAGRTLALTRTSGGVARATFAELCERPLGAADYIALARRYHTLVLSGIPRLSPDRRDAARRFVLLVDELYNHGVKLVASAEAEPQALYPSGTGAFEFRRTASRLVEMSGEKYLAGEHRPRGS